MDPRPQADTSEYRGCRITVIDASHILAAAATQEVELLHDAVFPEPVRAVRMTVTEEDDHDGRRVCVLRASVRTGPNRQPFAVLGNDPVGVFISRQVAAGEPWASRIVDGVGTAVAEVSRRLGRPPTQPTGDDAVHDKPIDSVVRDEPVTGLRAAVTVRGSASDERARTTTLRAVLPFEVASPEHLPAMFRLVLDVVAQSTGAQPTGADSGTDAGSLAGRHYVLSRYGVGAAGDTEHVTLDQVGGLDAVVGEFRQIAASFRHPQAMARWGARRPQGILLYGPPGTGKTMLARALANEIGATFKEIRTPEILDKWLGASERNIKRIFRDARRYREPTVMLFDEFDSIISYTGGGDDAASQALNAVAGIFKQEMNTLIEANPNVIVVATTNFPERVDQSLIRSGRFDVKLAIPVPDANGRREILVKAMRQLIIEHEVAGFRMFADDVDAAELAAACPGFTGADLKELLRRAQLAKAMQEARTGVASTPITQSDLRWHLADFQTQRRSS
jgi:transitional endoplasmic reticulum ATPase